MIESPAPMNDANVLAQETPSLLRATGLKKVYKRGQPVPVLHGVDFSIALGEFVSIIGASGSGKSTLLHLLGTLDAPTEGEIYWKGERIDNQSNRRRDRYRNHSIGFVFQFYHLLPELNVLENVMLPALIRLPAYRYFFTRKKYKQQAMEIIDRVGLGHRHKHKPNQLSGGEMQRASIARALFGNPELLLADEPTGNLDHETGLDIFQLMVDLQKETQLAVVMVTHDRDLAYQADRVVRLHQGQLQTLDDTPAPAAWTRAS